MDAEERLVLIKMLANDEAWDTVVFIGEHLLNVYYPESVFTGESGDSGPAYIVALREALRRVKKD